MLNSKGARAHKRESRPTKAAERLPVICQLGGDNHGNSTTHPRIQFQSRQVSVLKLRARPECEGGWLALIQKLASELALVVTAARGCVE